MSPKVLAIGDTHFSTKNKKDTDVMRQEVVNKSQEIQPDVVVLLGDVLDKHAYVHQDPFNDALELIHDLRCLAPTYVLIGNHDMRHNEEYLPKRHFFTPCKDWSNVFIVDEPTMHKDMVLMPYVPKFRFREALDTLGEKWKKASVIFAHQDFQGAKMGPQEVEADPWPLDAPQVVSGHNHNTQTPQANIFYPGPPYHTSFGDKTAAILCLVETSSSGVKLSRIPLNVPRKKTFDMTPDEVLEYTPKNTQDTVRIRVTGTREELKALSRNSAVKKLSRSGVQFRYVTTEEERPSLDNINAPQRSYREEVQQRIAADNGLKKWFDFLFA
jgi:predicted phosphodiesterase